MIPELSIIIPTLNERDNIEALLQHIDMVLKDTVWEVIFVDDDSTDGTLGILQKLARSDARIRYIHRVGRRGLSSACLEGMAASSAPFMAVMDADLQHDEKLLPQMLNALRGGQLDLVLGSRYMDKNNVAGLSVLRGKLSRAGIWLAHRILSAQISDPLSGFFMLTRPLYERVRYKVSGKGFKILLDILVSAGGALRYAELPFHFRARHAGSSKLDTLVVLEYAFLLLDKSVGKIIPSRFFLFAGVGMLGAILHLGILWLCLYTLLIPFVLSQVIATLGAIGWNFVLNNLFTHRDLRLKGVEFMRGILFFYIVCALGGMVNVAFASFLFEHQFPWWLAGLAGAIIGGVWNYTISSVFVWKRVHS